MKTTMVAFPFAILGILFIGAVVGGLIAGIILLIAGLAKHRRGVWVTGLVLLMIALTLLIGLGIVGVLGFFFVGRPTAVQGPIGTTVVAQADPATDFETVFAIGPDVPVPASARILGYSSRTDAAGETGRATIYVGEDIGSFLAEHFEKVKWDDVQAMMTGPYAGQTRPSGWDESRLPKADCYLRKVTDDQGRNCQTAVCHDRQARRLYCAWTKSVP